MPHTYWMAVLCPYIKNVIIRRIKRQSAGMWEKVFPGWSIWKWTSAWSMTGKWAVWVSLFLWATLELPLKPIDLVFRKCLLNHRMSAAIAMKLTGADMERRDEKTEPKRHFPVKPGQTEDLCLSRKNENICFPRHMNVCGFHAKPNMLSLGRPGSFQSSSAGLCTLAFRGPLSTRITTAPHFTEEISSEKRQVW